MAALIPPTHFLLVGAAIIWAVTNGLLQSIVRDHHQVTEHRPRGDVRGQGLDGGVLSKLELNLQIRQTKDLLNIQFVQRKCDEFIG